MQLDSDKSLRSDFVLLSDETDRRIGSLNDRQTPHTAADSNKSSGRQTVTETVKRIFLEIACSGKIEISGNSAVTKETILDILNDNLKPVLMNIIQSEIYEEGDMAYHY